ncbi:xanthine dehydrogenase, small subunit [Mycolicibacterium fortuitum subsp. acetamidolyticum]|uniref:Xanthine dehydrogenase, small subunit n=1 Tax=Mycolicibacterium fortuitum subsp. acetamidolyticum TaxID=144550 RepID=A0A100WR63_MYCFO|nr:xanthine dehydrogenase, small subunit [Mycolicibacterium fortuitum subsp. acetamidolyticum]
MAYRYVWVRLIPDRSANVYKDIADSDCGAGKVVVGGRVGGGLVYEGVYVRDALFVKLAHDRVCCTIR